MPCLGLSEPGKRDDAESLLDTMFPRERYPAMSLVPNLFPNGLAEASHALAQFESRTRHRTQDDCDSYDTCRHRFV